MDGMSTYQLYAEPSWVYATPAPPTSAPPGGAGVPYTGWPSNGVTPPYPASSTSPDPHAAFFDPTNLGAGGSFQPGAQSIPLKSETTQSAAGAGGAGASAGAGGSSAPASEKASTGKWRPDREAPVKNACLTCRGKKARCDGIRPICGQCSKKSLECVYVKSRRGGARKKREAPPPTALQAFLKKLDGLVSVSDASLSPDDSELGEDTTNIVRTFACKDEIFTCYYNEVHPFLPVMPLRIWQSEILPILSQESPFLLAVQTILVLVPHAKDPHPGSHASKAMRVRASTELGQYTMSVIEKKLAQESSIECVQALCILSLWEWGNAGNLGKNRARSGQALQVAMELGMHEMDNQQTGVSVTVEGADWRRDMARRTWWVTYVAQLSAAMISGNMPPMGPDDPRIKVNFPVCTLEDHSWPNWVNTVRHCVRAFGLINSVYFGPQAAEAPAATEAADRPEGTAWGSSPTHQPLTDEQIASNRQKMLDVDHQVTEFMKQAEATSVIDLVPGGEEEVVRNMQLSARLGLAVTHIHIHRQQAFPEVSLFSKRICGLPSAPDYTEQPTMPLLDQVAVPQALADGAAYSETAEYSALNNAMQHLDPSGIPVLSLNDPNAGDLDGDFDLDMDFTQEMWQPETYPEDLPAPWFAHAGGAAALYQPIYAPPQHLPPLTATIAPVTPSDASIHNGAGGERRERRGSVASQKDGTPRRSATPQSGPKGPHKAWGVDENSKIVVKPGADKGLAQVFPPGISLARCATAAHTIVRLEVLHRSAVIAMWDGPPKWLPFCACGLVTGAYAFLLLALAVQAENNFGELDDGKNEEVEALLTNVKVILAGLEAYGQMWAGIEVMANEVRAALEAAMRLPLEVRGQIESLHGSPPESSGGNVALGFATSGTH